MYFLNEFRNPFDNFGIHSDIELGAEEKEFEIESLFQNSNLNLAII